MKQIFTPTSIYKFEKIHKKKIQEKSYLIALSSKGLYHFQNNKVNKMIENITNSYAIEIQTNKKAIELFINELYVDYLHISNLPAYLFCHYKASSPIQYKCQEQGYLLWLLVLKLFLFFVFLAKHSDFLLF